MLDDLIPIIKESEERKIKTKKILDNIDLKKYINKEEV